MTSSFRFAMLAVLTFSLTLCAAALPSSRAAAQGMGQMQMPSFTQVVLTDDDIRNFIGSFPKLRALGEKYGSHFDGQALVQDPTAVNVPPAALAELDAILSQYGFSSVEQWQSIAYSTVLAHSWAHQNGGNPASALDQAIAGIRSNPQLTEEQRSMMIAQFEAQKQLMAAFRPIPENVQRVAKFEQELNRAISE